MANTLGTKAKRDKYRAAQVQQALKAAVVLEKVCIVDNSDVRTISSPYITAVSTTVQALTGTYTPAAITLTDDTLTVTDEFIAATHIFDFESATAQFDLFYTAHVAIANSIATAVNKWGVNELCANATGSVAAIVGGLTTAGNVAKYFSKITAACTGYDESSAGFYIVVQNSDLEGIQQYQGAAGFSYADAVLNNGYLTSLFGIDIYVVRDSTFVDATTTTASGSKTWTNSGHRVGGVKDVATYASPRGVHFEEKGRTGYTGMEVVGIAYGGFKQWTPTASLTLDIDVSS